MNAEMAPNAALRPFGNRINTVTSRMPWLWLAAGWDDLRATWRIGVPYALVFVAIGYLVTGGVHQLGHSYLIWPLACGFVLVAPAFCVGFYGISKARQEGREPTWRDLFSAWRTNLKSQLGTGLALLFFVIIWLRIAALIYVLFYPNALPTFQSIANQTFFTPHGLTFLATGTVVGAFFAAVAFLVSAVAPQVMMGERGDFLPSVLISVFSVTYNFRPMLLWAAIIVVATAAGMAALFAGLAVTLPLIGHASWHAYRDIVKPTG